MDRIENIFLEEKDIPKELFDELEEQRKRLLATKEKYGKDVISPFQF